MNLVPAGSSSFYFALGVVVLAGIFWLATRILNQQQGFLLKWVLAPLFLGLAFVVLWGPFHFDLMQDWHRSVDIQGDHLIVSTMGDTVSTPIRQISHVIAGEACKSPPRYSRSKGTNGPGLVAGWFKGERGPVFVDYVTRPNLCVQVAAGPGLALEVQDPAAFRKALVRQGFVDATTGVARPVVSSAPASVPGGRPTDDRAHAGGPTAADGSAAAAAGAQAAGTEAATPAAAEAVAAPRRLVVMGGTLTEIVYALGAGEQVVGVDQSSLYPPQARQLPQVGYFRQFSVEGVVALRPDRVIAATESGPPPALDKLRALGVPMALLELRPDLDALTARITELAALLGRQPQGEALVARIRQQVAEATRRKHPLRVLAVSGHAGRLQGAGRGTAADALLGMAGATNVLAGTHQGYKQLSPEAVAALQPDVILTSSLSVGKAGSAAFLAQPGIVSTPAARARRLVVLDDLLLLGFGPRVGEALQQLASGLAQASSPTAGPAR